MKRRVQQGNRNKFVCGGIVSVTVDEQLCWLSCLLGYYTLPSYFIVHLTRYNFDDHRTITRPPLTFSTLLLQTTLPFFNFIQFNSMLISVGNFQSIGNYQFDQSRIKINQNLLKLMQKQEIGNVSPTSVKSKSTNLCQWNIHLIIIVTYKNCIFIFRNVAIFTYGIIWRSTNSGGDVRKIIFYELFKGESFEYGQNDDCFTSTQGDL